jgi:hypothetical protein
MSGTRFGAVWLSRLRGLQDQCLHLDQQAKPLWSGNMNGLGHPSRMEDARGESCLRTSSALTPLECDERYPLDPPLTCSQHVKEGISCWEEEALKGVKRGSKTAEQEVMHAAQDLCILAHLLQPLLPLLCSSSKIPCCCTYDATIQPGCPRSPGGSSYMSAEQPGRRSQGVYSIPYWAPAD